MEERPSDDSGTSEWDSSFATLRRIDEIKKFIDFAIINNDQIQRYNYLRAFWFELLPIFNTKKEKVMLMGKEIEGSVLDYQMSRFESAKNLDFGTDVTARITVANFLDQWEIELRTIEQKEGMNLKVKGDLRYALGKK